MAKNRSREIHRINYLTSEMDALYHQASVKLGISDSVCIVLYHLYDVGGACLLREILASSGISKQTANSALRNLEAKGLLCLEAYNGRSKRVMLTQAGMEYAEKTVGRLFQAEMGAFDGWTEDEIAAYLQLQEKYAACLRMQINKM